MASNHKEVETGTVKKKKKGLLLMFVVLMLIVGISIAVWVLKPFGNQMPDTVEVDGVLLIDSDSPENKILLSQMDSGPEGWKLYPDVEKEKEAVDKQILAFIKVLDKKNAKQAAGFFTEAEQKMYRSLLEENEESLSALSEAFSSLEMVYLSAPSEVVKNDFYRMAEYQGMWNGAVFSVVFVKEDGKWKILHL
jgi:hypothetical protein